MKEQKQKETKKKNSSLKTLFLWDNEPLLYRDNRGSFIWAIQMINPDESMLEDLVTFLEVTPKHVTHRSGSILSILISLNVYDIMNILRDNRFPYSRLYNEFVKDVELEVPGKYIHSYITNNLHLEFAREEIKPQTDDYFNENDKESLALKDKYDIKYVSENVKVVGLDIPKNIYEKVTNFIGLLNPNGISYNTCLQLCRITFDITNIEDRDYGRSFSYNFHDLYTMMKDELLNDDPGPYIDLKYLLESEGEITIDLDNDLDISKINPWSDSDEDVDDILSTEEEIIDSSKVPDSNYIGKEGENNNGNEK